MTDIHNEIGFPPSRIRENIDFLKACIFSMTQKEKREYTERIRNLVEEYKPKIEERTGVELGETKVLPLMTALNRYYFNSCKDLITMSSANGDKPISKVQRAGLVALGLPFTIGISVGFYPIYALIGLHQNNSGIFRGSDSSIAFTTGTSTRMRLWAEKYFGRELHLPQSVVHELSHHLWKKIAPEKKEKSGFLDDLYWNEGFATYCETEFFRDLYPKDYEFQDMKEFPKRYVVGKQKVQQAIQNHGLDILLQIPNKWLELEKEQERR